VAKANIMTPEFRVDWNNVFHPKKNELSGKEEYALTALFPKGADLSAMKAAANAAIVEKWGEDKTKWPKNLRSPFRDQGEKDGPQYEEGAVFMNLKSKQRPGVVDAKVQDIIDETEFYRGCYARATVQAYAYDQAGNRGVSFGLQNIQKMKDGEPMGGGRAKASSEFEAVGGGGSSDDIFG
jgi:hypothetical protein